MVYAIRNYDESFLPDQVRIGKEVIDKYWRGLGQSPIDRLKLIYSQPNFNPTSKFYAFQGDEMVGFLTSTVDRSSEDEITARMEFPLVLDAHKVTEKVLIDSCFTYLQNNGVSKVYSRGGEDWGNSLEHIHDYGYEFDEFSFWFGEIFPENIDSTILEVEDTQINNIKKFEALEEEQVKAYYIEIQGFSEQFFNAVKRRHESNSPNTRSWCFVVENNEIITSSRMFVGMYGKNNLALEEIRKGFDKHSRRKIIMNYQLREAIRLNISKLRIYIDDEELFEFCQSYGTRFNAVNMYKLSLS